MEMTKTTKTWSKSKFFFTTRARARIQEALAFFYFLTQGIVYGECSISSLDYQDPILQQIRQRQDGPVSLGRLV